ncbi:MAG: winged helix-turn-helix transcriptional regulator [Chloroflexi bacterium]|jgi:DNA-binding MarR family transcriptional regulator|nr:winged helix-turn-helix transcriptional regulator [Chloroflexota bacterium]
MDNNLEEAAKRFLKLASRLRRLGANDSHPEDGRVSPSHLPLIEYAAKCPGCGIQEMAEGLKLATPTVSISVRQLEKRSMLTRQPHPEDGRAVQIFLTPKGQEVHQQSHAFHRRKFEQLLTGLPPEERQLLLDLLERALNIAETK